MTVIRNEFAGSISGVEGRFHNVIAWPAPVREGKPLTLANQVWGSVARAVKGYGPDAEMRVEIRHDDNCKNGHESFAVTADVTTPRRGGYRESVAGGAMHEEIARIFPELAPLIRWHLCDIDGPMHYLANAVYLAGDRDHNGLLAGEVRQLRNGKTGQLAWKLAAVSATGQEIPMHELERYVDADEAPPAPATLKYVPWTRVGEGKARELDAARRAAVWPDATDAVLCAHPDVLREALKARLPALVAEMRRDVEGAGFIWAAPQA